jgi:hypothetical protein
VCVRMTGISAGRREYGFVLWREMSAQLKYARRVLADETWMRPTRTSFKRDGTDAVPPFVAQPCRSTLLPSPSLELALTCSPSACSHSLDSVRTPGHTAGCSCDAGCWDAERTCAARTQHNAWLLGEHRPTHLYWITYWGLQETTPYERICISCATSCAAR